MGLSTKRLGEAVGVKPESIVRRVCTHGSYFGVKPTKLPNRRLLWPDDTVERLKNPRASDQEAVTS